MPLKVEFCEKCPDIVVKDPSHVENYKYEGILE